MTPAYSFDIIFSRQDACESFSKSDHRKGLVQVSDEVKRACAGRDGFLEGVTAVGASDLLPALDQALKERPQLIYFMANLDFPDSAAVMKKINDLNKDRKIRINTIAFTGDLDKDTDYIKVLKDIAEQSGGVYRHVIADELKN